jgi:hypothetical protein
MAIRIITHRGLDPAISDYYVESSIEAFTDQIRRGYGLEFDVQFSLDNIMIATHDPSLERISKGKDKRKIREIESSEILGMEFSGCHLTTVSQVLSLIADSQVPGALSALHLKYLWQEPRFIDLLLVKIKSSEISPDKFMIFDVKPEIAKYIKKVMPELNLAASVAHPYDIERYNGVVGGTLISLDDILSNKDLYSSAWLDEWDLTDKNSGIKKLYTKEIFENLRAEGFRIAVISPELHAKSPWLLGGEAHPDGKNKELLIKRLKEILSLRPDAICTDWPDLVKTQVISQIGLN